MTSTEERSTKGESIETSMPTGKVKSDSEERLTKGESIGISMPTGKVNSDAAVTNDDTADTANAASVAASRIYYVATANEPPLTTLLIATLADDDPTIATTAVASSSNNQGMISGAVAPSWVPKTTNKLLADDDPIIDADKIAFHHDGAPLNNGTALFHQIRIYAHSVLKRCATEQKKNSRCDLVFAHEEVYK